MAIIVKPDVGGMHKPVRAAAAITAGQVCAYNSSGYAALADADHSTAALRKADGIAKDDAASGEFVTLVDAGTLENMTAGTAGAEIFLSTTAGGITETVPSSTATAALQHIGRMLTTTKAIFRITPTTVVAQAAGTSTVTAG